MEEADNSSMSFALTFATAVVELRVSTDIDGNYALRVKSRQNKISISLIGYKTITMDINDRSTLKCSYWAFFGRLCYGHHRCKPYQYLSGCKTHPYGT